MLEPASIAHVRTYHGRCSRANAGNQQFGWSRGDKRPTPTATGTKPLRENTFREELADALQLDDDIGLFRQALDVGLARFDLSLLT